MTLEQFNNWIKENYNSLSEEIVRKYPALKETIHSNMNDFYYFAVEGKKYESILNIKSFIYTYIYNRNFVYFNNTLSDKNPTCTNIGKMFVSLEIFMNNMYEGDNSQEPFDFFMLSQNKEFIEDEEELKSKMNEEHYYLVIDKIIEDLPIDKKKLYKMYFEEGMSYRQIGAKLGVTHTSIYLYMKELLKVVKNGFIDDTGMTDRKYKQFN